MLDPTVKEKILKGAQCLVDNGISKNEALEVLEDTCTGLYMEVLPSAGNHPRRVRSKDKLLTDTAYAVILTEGYFARGAITQLGVSAAGKTLMYHGIDDAWTVLQALCYILFDVEIDGL